MSKTAKALLVKFIVTFAAASLAFWSIQNRSLLWPFVIALAGTILNYLIGDLGILPRAGKFIASLADGGLAAATAYLIDLASPAFDATGRSYLTFAILVAVAEYIFHIYLLRTPEVEP